MIHHSTVYRRGFSGGGFCDVGQVQGQDQDQGQGQDHLLLQRAALPLYLVLTLVLALTMDLAQITKPLLAKPQFAYSRSKESQNLYFCSCSSI